MMRHTTTAVLVVVAMPRLLAQGPAIEPIRSDSLAHPDDATKGSEMFWTKPKGNGPWPVLILVHGHQEGAKPGARTYGDGGALQRFAALGMLVAAFRSRATASRMDRPITVDRAHSAPSSRRIVKPDDRTRPIAPGRLFCT